MDTLVQYWISRFVLPSRSNVKAVPLFCHSAAVFISVFFPTRPFDKDVWSMAPTDWVNMWKCFAPLWEIKVHLLYQINKQYDLNNKFFLPLFEEHLHKAAATRYLRYSFLVIWYWCVFPFYYVVAPHRRNILIKHTRYNKFNLSIVFTFAWRRYSFQSPAFSHSCNYIFWGPFSLTLYFMHVNRIQ